MQHTHSGARLILVNLIAPCQEQHAETLVSGVVKNQPFSAEFAMEGSFNHYEVDFHRWRLRCTLLYDCTPEREVQCVKSNPVIWTTNVNETGEQATMNIRLQILSSQHEDMHFRIKFLATPPSTHSIYYPLEVISPPIRVVSKQQQLRPLGTNPPPAKTRKRPRTTTPPVPNTTSSSRNKRGRIEKPETPSASEFLVHLNGMIAAFNRIPQTERHTQLKEVLQGDCTDLLCQLQGISDTLLKSTTNAFCCTDEEEAILMQALPSMECGDSIPNLDCLDVGDLRTLVTDNLGQPNPDGLFSSWDFEEKKDFELEVNVQSEVPFPSTSNSTPSSPLATSSSYEPNPLSRSQELFEKLADFQMADRDVPNSPVPNLDLLDASTVDSMGLPQPYFFTYTDN